MASILSRPQCVKFTHALTSTQWKSGSIVTSHNLMLIYIHLPIHDNDVIMSTMASQINSLAIVYSAVYSRRRSKKTSKLRVTRLRVGNLPWPVNSPHKGPVKRKMFPFDDVIMTVYSFQDIGHGWGMRCWVWHTQETSEWWAHDIPLHGKKCRLDWMIKLQNFKWSGYKAIIQCKVHSTKRI